MLQALLATPTPYDWEPIGYQALHPSPPGPARGLWQAVDKDTVRPKRRPRAQVLGLRGHQKRDVRTLAVLRSRPPRRVAAERVRAAGAARGVDREARPARRCRRVASAARRHRPGSHRVPHADLPPGGLQRLHPAASRPSRVAHRPAAGVPHLLRRHHAGDGGEADAQEDGGRADAGRQVLAAQRRRRPEHGAGAGSCAAGRCRTT